MNLSPITKKLFTISLILYVLNKIGPTKGILLKDFALPLIISITSCPLINLDFLLSHTTHFDRSLVFPFLSF